MDDRDLQRRAIAILDLVLDLDPASRPTELERLCGGDADLRALVESLVAADEAGHDLLDAAPGVVPHGSTQDQPAPSRVGPYRLIGEVGRGGMSTVYLAEREVAGARQRVALKLIRGAIATEETVRRFARETRLLASLEHPGIARFHDARSSEEGLPYLAMEFVHGLPITEHCDDQALDLRARLGLFLEVCEAVEYAHRRLVVHRDLKPSNILVTDRGQVKLLDFGIAKILSDEEAEGADLTRTGVRVLTPRYAAPEQLLGGPVTTATDVYSLGVVLFELLTGEPPAPSGDRSSSSRSSSDPPLDHPRPSTAARRAARQAHGGAAAAARSATTDRLVRALRGDLDTICGKALESDPARRYSSARELADDISRHLQGRPIHARPATPGYRLAKFARRHRAGVISGVAGGALTVAFGILYAVGITRERDAAEAEAVKAQVTTQFLQRLLGEAYPSVALGDTFSMSELLARAVARVDSLETQPEVQAEILRTLGDVYREQGQFTEARPLLERAVALHRVGGAAGTRSAGRALDALGHLLYEMGDYEAALETHREALGVFEALYQPDDSLTLFALNNVAASTTALGDYDEGLRIYQTVLDRSGRLFSDTSELVHVTHNNRGNLFQALGDHQQAERALTTAVSLKRRALPPDHPSLGLALNNLGVSLRALDRLDEAEAAHQESLDIFLLVFGPEHPRVGLGAFNLAQVQRASGRYDQAEENFRTTLAVDRAAYGEQHLEVGVDLRTLGFLLEEKGDCIGAVSTLSEADSIFQLNGLAMTHGRRLTARARMATCLDRLGRAAEGEEILRESLEAAWADPSGADEAGVRESAERLAEIYLGLGRPEAADSARALGELAPR